MDKIKRIAIDGPSGAGKSTIAKAVAQKLSIDYIDTGAMYRAIAYKILSKKINIENEIELKAMLDETSIDFSNGNIILDGKIINDKIRTPEVTKMASQSSAKSLVREKLVELQRNIGMSKSIIMDGRDIGTNVLVDAEYKFFMTASCEERAKRRYLEMKEKDQEEPYKKILEDIKDRDHNDSTRLLNPLRKAEDAIELDTTGMLIEEVIDVIYKEVSK